MGGPVEVYHHLFKVVDLIGGPTLPYESGAVASLFEYLYTR
jgi:hypothetical protein